MLSVHMEFELRNFISNSREQEKAEIKDKKVLVILNEKDNNIKILEEVSCKFGKVIQ